MRRPRRRSQAPSTADPLVGGTRPPTAIVVGLLQEGLGLGEAARGYAAALHAAGFEVFQHQVALPGRPASLGDPGSEGVVAFREVDAAAEADLVLICLNPPEVALLREAGADLPSGRVNVGMWAWEVDPLPPSWPALAERWRLDELWAISPFVAGLLAPATDVPVEVIVPPVWSTSAPPGATVDAARPFFLVVMDGASTFARKNPVGAIEAFTRAFAPGEGPQLVVKLWNGEVDPPERERLEMAAAGRPDVEIIDRWLPREEYAALLAAARAVVSLHRSEGLGLVPLEALAAGVVVIATEGTGLEGVVGAEGAFFVRAGEALVPPGTAAYPEGSRWREPDLDDAARLMREVWVDPEAATGRAQRGGREVQRTASVAACAAAIRVRAPRVA